MKKLGFATLGAAVALLPAPALATSDSPGTAIAAAARAGVHSVHVRRHWGGSLHGRWVGGHRAPGGWAAYRRPFRGHVLPRYWVAPGFHIGNYDHYGFARPHPGTAWSRYYDDAVLIDGRGHVYDQVHNVDWDRYDEPHGAEYPVDYRDGYEGEYRRYDGEADYADYEEEYYRRDDGTGGAIIGGVVGGIAGNRIAGRGNRTEGTLIGAGVGAIAGAAIDRAEDRRRYDRDVRPYPYGADYDHGHVDDRVTYGYRERRVHGPRLPYHSVIDGHQIVYARPGTTTTIVIQPAVTTTTTTTTEFIEEVAHVPRYRKASVRRYKPKPRCECR